MQGPTNFTNAQQDDGTLTNADPILAYEKLRAGVYGKPQRGFESLPLR